MAVLEDDDIMAEIKIIGVVGGGQMGSEIKVINQFEGSDSEEMSSKTSEETLLNQVKTCADCGTSKTPLWRGGPAGLKSLCNACGIRSRKKRRALLCLNKDDKKSKKNTNTPSFNTSNSNNQSDGSSSSGINGNKLGDSLKRKLVALGRQVVLQRPRSTMSTQRRKKLGEEEQAAMLLMAQEQDG